MFDGKHRILNRLASAALISVLLVVLCPLSASAAGPATVTIPVDKVITGDVPTVAENFEFQLTALLPSNPMPAGSVAGVYSMTMAGSGSGSIGPISFTTPGIYTYEISEVAGSNTAYAYDSKVYTLTVTVENNGSGGLAQSTFLTLPASVTKYSKATFTNNYTAPVIPPSSSGSLIISKTVTGSLGDTDKEFHFIVRLMDSLGNPLAAAYSYTGVGLLGGTISSGDRITLKNGHRIIIRGLPIGSTYSVTEVEANQDGYTTTVTGDTGTISSVGNASTWVNHKAGSSSPRPTSVNLTAVKTFDGTIPTINTFTFLLKESSGYVIQTKNNSGRNVTFDTIVYTSAGVYTYYITEQAGASGVIYDTSVYTVTVNVTESAGNLVANVATLKDGAPYTGMPEFRNTTDTSGASTRNITASKAWSDNDDADGKRPSSVTLELYRDGTLLDSATVSAATGWQHTFAGVPSDGSYYVKEGAVTDYSATYTGNANYGFAVTNTYTPGTTDPGDPSAPSESSSDSSADPNNSGSGTSGSGSGASGNNGNNNGNVSGNNNGTGGTGNVGGNGTGAGTGGSSTSTPQTGDNSNTGLWISLMIISFCGMLTAAHLLRKNIATKNKRKSI